MAARNAPRLHPAEDAAPSIGVSPFTLATKSWRLRHGIPSIRVGRLVRYDLGQLRKWAEARQVHEVDEGSGPA